MKNLDTFAMERVFFLKNHGKSEKEVIEDLVPQKYHPYQLSYLYNSLVKPGKILTMMLMHLVIFALYAYISIASLHYLELVVHSALFPILAISIIPVLFAISIFWMYEKPITGYKLIIPQFIFFIISYYLISSDLFSWPTGINTIIGIAGLVLTTGCYWYNYKEKLDPSLA